MPVTAVFFLGASGPDSSPIQDILARLTSQYEPAPLPNWSLSHRLFRETPSAVPLPNQQPTSANGVDKAKPSGPRFLQVLTLSHHTQRTYVSITSTNAPSQTRAGTPASSNLSAETASGEPATVISIPSGPSSDEFVQLIVSKFGPIWQQRQMLSVGNGTAFEIGDFRVRVGEVRQSGIGGVQMGRGALCELSWSGDSGEEKEESWEAGETVVRGFWEGLGIRGAREVFWVPGLGDGEGTIRQWCEILRAK